MYSLRPGLLATLSLSFATLIIVSAARAQSPDTAASDNVVTMEKFVTGATDDPNGFKPASNNVFGTDKPTLETPRSVSVVTGDMIEKFNIGNMTDLERFSPSSFTSFSFGVQSALQIRGDTADMYYDGMKKVNNANNLPTPLGPSDGVAIVRGPPSAAYGEGLVGGYIDFTPKSARATTGAYLSHIVGKLTFTADTVGGRVGSAEFGGPMTFFGKKAGFYIYDQVIDSDTWYIGQHVRDETLQATMTVDLSDSLRFETGLSFYNHNGSGIAGWNRVTQDLIYNGNYQAGMENLDLINPGGQNGGFASRAQLYNAGLTNNLNYGPGALPIAKQVAPGTTAYTNPNGPLALVNNVHMTTLSPRQVALERVNAGDEYLWFADLVKEFSPSITLKNNFFFEHQNYHKYSDLAYFREGITSMGEDRVTLQWQPTNLPSWLKVTDVLAANSRFLETQNKTTNVFQIFNYWDLTVYNQGYYGWANGYLSPGLAGVDSNALSQHTESGLGNLLDIDLFDKLDIAVGNRYDYVDARLHNYPGLSINGATVLAPAVVVPFLKGHAKASSLTSLSISFKILPNIIPYVTYATPKSVIPGGTGGLVTAQLQTQILTPSKLEESGIKCEFFDKKLYLTFANYEQYRTAYNAALNGGNGGFQQTKSYGDELEARWVPIPNFSLSGAIDWIREYTDPLVPGFTPVPVQTTPLNNLQFAGGRYQYGYTTNGWNEYRAAPERQGNLFGDYIFGHSGYDISAGISYSMGYWASNIHDIYLPGAVQYSLDIGYANKKWEVRISGSNLTNKITFYPTSGGAAVIPNPGRIGTAKFTYKF